MAAAVLFLITAVGSFVLCFPVHRLLLRWNMIDRPNERSSHSRPTARGGGIAVLMAVMFVGTFAVNATWSIALIALAGLVLAVVSFIDDLKSLRQLLRFAVQASAAVIALYALGFGGGTGLSPVSTIGIAVIGFLWITGYTNAFNFMDGINGLAGMQVVTTSIGTALVGIAAGGTLDHPAIILSLVLAGAGIGFLPHNFPRARMFLGDVGSAPLGFLLAVFAFWLARDLGWWLLGAFGLLHANFVLDTTVTLARRIWRGDRWFESHREHFFQRLVRAGKSHVFVTGWESVLQIIVLIIVVATIKQDWLQRFVAAGVVCVLWVGFFAYAELQFRRSLSSKAAY